jgi:formyl-CoA transferase
MSRTIPPYFVGEESSFFLSANRGKRSIAVDLKKPQGHQVLLDVARKADAIIYGFRPDVPKKLGIDYESLQEVNPRIVVGQIVGIHDEGEFASTPAFDLVVQAMGGFMSITGEQDGGPVRGGYQVADLCGGAYLALGVAAAMCGAQRSGRGTHVQISLLDCQLALLTWQAQNFFVSGNVPRAEGSRHPMIAPSEAFQGSDGEWFVISPTGDRFWRIFCDALGDPALCADTRFRSGEGRLEHVDELSRTLKTIFSKKPAREWVAQLSTSGVPVALVLDVEEALSQPAARMRSMVESLPDPVTGDPVQFLGNPFKTPGQKRESLSYPPALGQDTRSILRDYCGYSEERIDDLLRDSSISETKNSTDTTRQR